MFPRGERVGKEHEAAFKSGSRGSSANDPYANDAKDALRERERFPSACAAGKLHVAPRKGSALLFWSVDPTGHDDPKSLHGGCAVDRGEKWTATKWLRHGPYGAEREQREKARIRRARGTNDDEKNEKSASAVAKATS